jgi:hypothetical protein
MLAVDLEQFLGDLRMADAQFLADAEQRLVDAKTGVDTDDEEIDGVRDAAANFLAAAFDQTRQNDIGHDESYGGKREDPEGSTKRYKGTGNHR